MNSNTDWNRFFPLLRTRRRTKIHASTVEMKLLRKKHGLLNIITNSKSHRRFLIKNKKSFPFASLHAAAIEIQRVVRGYQSRRIVFNVEPNIRQMIKEEETKRKLMVYDRYSSTIQFMEESEETKSQFLAMYHSIIQSRILAVITRHTQLIRMNQHRYWMYHAAAIAIQRRYRKHKRKLTKKYGSKRYFAKGRVRFYDPKEDAASIIQRSWKKFFNNQIYKFYRDLIVFKERLDPITLLRGINPLEANLVDPASKIHVRFRLGGSKFPPTIFYKIYTHSPIVDINAFAPRDYIRERQVNDPKQIHSHSSDRNGENERNGWYQRYENNGWRPVSGRSLNDFNIDSSGISVSTSVKDRILKESQMKTTSQPFHYNSLQRKQELVTKRKRRKVEWMKKMYKMHLVKQRNKTTELQEQPEATTCGMDSSSDDSDYELDMMDENQLQELLDWSSSLDYEEYVQEWTGLAITLPSDRTRYASEPCISHDVINSRDENKIEEEVETRYSHETGGTKYSTQTEMVDNILFGGVGPSASELYLIEREKLMNLLNSK